MRIQESIDQVWFFRCKLFKEVISTQKSGIFCIKLQEFGDDFIRHLPIITFSPKQSNKS